ncbi:hypothetical protein NIES37_48620 [Tolypothrix tenuis PCC 7101]|uniref:Uncharacterized protein n=1 Tax=Tolypothrix tenuis PCC 7101 TaxID=231146 RepID=A0A1Z4N574_9CYAN|nr:hypothetical protein NIES37_48620 [Tolypothrix tenuis PCC 7101]BAZ75213.1 hypothetical protein NIES50_37930 [Aulosira laxa NIES-50]
MQSLNSTIEALHKIQQQTMKFIDDQQPKKQRTLGGFVV